jgi:hypothetical protein
MEDMAKWVGLYKEAVSLTLLLLLVWGASRGWVFFTPERNDLIKQRDEANARAEAKDRQYTAMLERLLEVTKGWADAARTKV